MFCDETVIDILQLSYHIYRLERALTVYQPCTRDLITMIKEPENMHRDVLMGVTLLCITAATTYLHDDDVPVLLLLVSSTVNSTLTLSFLERVKQNCPVGYVIVSVAVAPPNNNNCEAGCRRQKAWLVIVSCAKRD